uniref:Uncharacterized protein LOC105633115 n=1 Tax=Rhizophora mucronata TaxID=61149 RepID=A0A2P2Q563_RHIMU
MKVAGWWSEAVIIGEDAEDDRLFVIVSYKSNASSLLLDIDTKYNTIHPQKDTKMSTFLTHRERKHKEMNFSDRERER